jgi:hypothetical protein
MAAPMKCCIHVCKEEKGGLSKLSRKNYMKISDKINDWSTLDGIEKEIAILLSEERGIYQEHANLFNGNVECMSCSTCSVHLSRVGSNHSKCYARFTDKSKIERARKRLKDGNLKPNVKLCPTVSTGEVDEERICPNIYLHLGSWSESRTLHVNTISKELGERVCKALIGLYCFTGCDSTSAFKGQGKVKALKTMLGNVSYQNIFQEIGKEWEINDISPTIEKFVCELYGKNDMEAVNDVRDQIFKMRFKLDASLPPNRDALVNHAKRANYQAAIHQRSLQQTVGAPSPIGFGWRKDQYDHIVPLWNTMPWAPHSLLKHFTCSCKKTKCMGNSKCSCKEHGLPCTEVCKCIDCGNQATKDAEGANTENGNNESDRDDDSDDERR